MSAPTTRNSKKSRPSRALAAALLALLPAAAGIAAGADSSVPLGIDTPREGTTVASPVPWIELRGRVGVPGRHDLVLVLDFSGSTLSPSGYDLDGDGDVWQAHARGSHRYRGLPPSVSRLDGDTVLGAEVAAAERLLETLEGSDTRVGLVQFGRRARVVGGLGSVEDARSALSRMRLSDSSGDTLLHGALERATTMLAREEHGFTPGIDRRSVVVVTDGFTGDDASSGEGARIAAELAAIGAEVHVLVIMSRYDVLEAAPLEALVATTGGSLRVLEDIRELPVLIQQPELSGVRRLRIWNGTTGEPGRAVRLFPNGEFDAFVALAEGENELRVEADAGPRGESSRVRRVRYEPTPAVAAAAPGPDRGADPAKASAAARARANGDGSGEGEAVLELMRRRTLETQLFAETRRHRSEPYERLLELEVDVGAGPP